MVLATVVAAAAAATASAGTPARWDRVTAADDGATYQAGLARTDDGTLHVAWLKTEPGNTRSLQHTPISRRGAIGAAGTIQPAWAFMANPDLILTPDRGLRVFFGGQRTTVTGDPNSEMNTATADPSGSIWTLQPFDAARGAQAGSDAGAATAADGAPFVSWWATSGVFVHRGVSPLDPNFDYQGALGGCCGYLPDLAVDGATGQMVLAWFSNAAGRQGVWAQPVDAATGAPAGAPAPMPGSATNGESVQMVSRTPVTGRPGQPGVYVAYPGGHPAQNRVLLWQVGSPAARVLARARNATYDQTGIAAAPDGRLWAFWSEKAGGRYRIVAARSNPAATRFGAQVQMRPPRGSVDDFHLDGNAQAGRLDLLGAFGRVEGTSTWHRQVLPGLTLVATRRDRRGAVNVRARVLDAGDPVAGVTVRAGGRRATTNRRGRVTLRLRGAGRRLRVTATGDGYTTARITVR